MEWRKIGDAGERYPKWVRELRDVCGVYAIRERGWFSTTIVYVGESHTNQLYKTLTRHFARWNRQKKWWRGAFQPAQTDPGHTYVRGDVEVAVKVASKAEAVKLQSKWIARLKPRDNVALVDVEEAPF